MAVTSSCITGGRPPIRPRAASGREARHGAVAVEDVLLQQRGERFHVCAVPAGADPAPASDHAVEGQGAEHLPASELRAAVGVDHERTQRAVPFRNRP